MRTTRTETNIEQRARHKAMANQILEADSAITFFSKHERHDYCSCGASVYGPSKFLDYIVYWLFKENYEGAAGLHYGTSMGWLWDKTCDNGHFLPYRAWEVIEDEWGDKRWPL